MAEELPLERREWRMKQNVTSLFNALFWVLVASLSTAPAYALPQTDVGGIMVYHFKPNGTVSGLDGMINLDEKTDFQDADRCEHRAAVVTIDAVVYEGVSEIVAGFRTEDDTLYRVSIEALYKNVANSQRGLIRDLFKRSQQVLISYSVCGSGGFIFLNEIFKVSAVKGLSASAIRKKMQSSSGVKNQIVLAAPIAFSEGNVRLPGNYPPSGGSLVRKDLGR